MQDDCENQTIPVLMLRRRYGRTEVKCPLCKRWQEFVIGPEDYQVATNGLVSPDFVCMVRPNGHWCEYTAMVRVKS